MNSTIFHALTGQIFMVFGAILFQGVESSTPFGLQFWGSFSRVLANFFLTLILFRWFNKKPSQQNLGGLKKGYLILWGFLGSLTIFFYFKSLAHVGVGISGFLLSSGGSMLVILSLFFKGSRPASVHLILALCCLFGSSLLSLEFNNPEDFSKLSFGITSAFCAAIAYLLTARKLSHESPFALMFYWSIGGLFLHALKWPFGEPLPPLGILNWSLLLSSGFIASLGQFWLIRSYQAAKSFFSGILSYFSAVFGAAAELFIFDHVFSTMQLLGILVILSSNGWLLYQTKFNSKSEHKNPETLHRPRALY